MTNTRYLEAMQAALAGEHAAVYGYGVIGGRLQTSTPAQERASAAYTAHRTRRDALVAKITAAGQTPVQAAPGYEIATTVTDESTAGTLAIKIERRCAVLYATVIAVADPPRRSAALDALIACATGEVTWGQAPSSFPGVR